MANKSNNSAQTISIPKGGGALHGIGETFSPDLHTGTGNFNVPLDLPLGRHGFRPMLNLVYSTGNGNGPFGFGWSLDIPGINRRTSKGIPRYRDGSPDAQLRHDTFVLSGAEDLVAVGVGTAVTRYRPRTEGLFARIEHHVSADTNHWEVRSKDGLTSVYGTRLTLGAASAVIANPENRSEVFGWKLTSTVDAFGNSIEYEYERESGDAPEHSWDQLYLKRIRYADFDEPGADGDPVRRFLISVTFVYEQRPDPFSDHRAGFEIRTQRRCTSIEIRTHADRERLVRTYSCIYLDRRGVPIEQLPLNGASLLTEVVCEGHDEARRETMPSLQFGYTPFEPATRRFQPFSGEGGMMPPFSLGHPEYELVDLFGSGLPAVLECGGQVRYWRNLGGGRFDRMRTMESAPAGVRLTDPGVQLLDANGNGRADLMVAEGARSGYYPLTFAGEWNERGFVRYRDAPTVNLDASDVRLFDLDGDGVTDALRTGAQFELYYNDPDYGWWDFERRERIDSESFPNVTFADPRVKLGDMNGDGLQDILRIHNGLVEYWPYRGYGRWGHRVAMRNSPRFEDALAYAVTGFDPKRLMVGDVDGDGMADLVYVSSGHITVWINQHGNGWSDPVVIHGTPPVSDASAVRLADMLGTGTAGILWTYDFGAFPDSTYKFLDLTGGVKPYVLNRMDNQMGALTEVSYASSTRFFLEDQEQPGTRWGTPLPFPVQVVQRVVVTDRISGGRLATQYRYHHGYWDGVEREFRGFGMVEQLDSETFAEYEAAGPHGAEASPAAVAEAYFSPPLLTKNWFHQGPIDEESGIWRESNLIAEFWAGDPPALTYLVEEGALLQGFTQPRHKRDALRSLRGRLLRSELYALDGSPRQERPYTVREHAYSLREESLPSSGDLPQRQRIFFAHPVGQRTTQWERGEEPMTQFVFTDEYDAYGQARLQMNFAVPRHRDYRLDAAPGSPYLATLEQTQYAQRDDAQRYMVNRVCASSSFEIANDGSLGVRAFHRQVQEGSVSRVLLGQSFNYYDGEAFVGLPFGQIGDFGALVRSESLVLTEEIASEAYEDPGSAGSPHLPPHLPPYLRPPGQDAAWPVDYPQEFRQLTPELGGYAFADGSDQRARGYFVQSLRAAFDFHASDLPHRGLPVAMRDAAGSDNIIDYDPYHLLPVQVTDAAGLRTRAQYDYRVLQPWLTTDPNGNRAAVKFSPLGLVIAGAALGKEGAEEGDTIETPGSRLEYDLFAFARQQKPVFVRTIARQHHVNESGVLSHEANETIEQVEYSDGFGRLLQTCAQAQDVSFGDGTFGRGLLPMDLSTGGPDSVGRRREAHHPPNVIVSALKVYDNKGRVIQQFEPYFAAGWNYAPPSASQLGHATTLFRDPRGRVVRTVKPDGSEQRVIYGIPTNVGMPEQFAPTPWEAYTYDANDLAPLCNSPDGSPLRAFASESHHFTPSSIIIDALGRVIETIARNREAPQNSGDPLPPIQELRTRSNYDVKGNLVAVTDALDRIALRYRYDLLGRAWRIESIDGGVRRMVLNASGNVFESRDSKGAVTLHAYDRLQRPNRVWARDVAGATLALRQRMEYGDSADPDQSAIERAAMQALNLLGRVHRHHDEAGLTTVERVDFKGNVLDKERRVIADAPMLAVFADAPANGWQVTPFLVDWHPAPQQTLAERESELLEPSGLRTTSEVDALNRITRLQLPRDVNGERPELRPTYHRGGGLEQVRLNGTLYVEHVFYNAKGQRALIAHGNGVMTRYAYDERTFRLKRMRSERYVQPDDLTYRPGGEVLQDYAYDYDLVGNIVRIDDRAPGSGVLNNPESLTAGDATLAQLLASGDAFHRRFDYDAIYRLVRATGRECERPPEGGPWLEQPRSTDITRTQGYTERYRYDPMGNMLRLEHRNTSGSFTREFRAEAADNRLRRMEIGTERFDYEFDACGNMRSETSARHFEWNHANQMKAFFTQTAGAEPSVHAQYLYDSAGERVKKLVRKQGGQIEVTHFIDGVIEHHRWNAGSQGGENNVVHVMDERERIALVRVGLPAPGDLAPAIRVLLGDHLGSSNVAVDSDGALINREEFTPYGETSFGSFAKKRYRFTGRARDEESGLNYHRARYYAPWLARWTGVDPLGPVDGPNMYRYARSNPLLYRDRGGTETENTSEADSGLSDEELTSVAPEDWDPTYPFGPPPVIGVFRSDQERDAAQKALNDDLYWERQDERRQANHARDQACNMDPSVVLEQAEDVIPTAQAADDSGVWGDIELGRIVKFKGPQAGGGFQWMPEFYAFGKTDFRPSIEISLQGEYKTEVWNDDLQVRGVLKTPGVYGKLGADEKGLTAGGGVSFGSIGMEAESCFYFCIKGKVDVGPKVEVGFSAGSETKVRMPLVSVGVEVSVREEDSRSVWSKFSRFLSDTYTGGLWR